MSKEILRQLFPLFTMQAYQSTNLIDKQKGDVQAADFSQLAVNVWIMMA